MPRSENMRSHAVWVRGFAALWTVLALGIFFGARPAEGAPLVYVTNESSTMYR
jgi:hypothetical protein